MIILKNIVKLSNLNSKWLIPRLENSFKKMASEIKINNYQTKKSFRGKELLIKLKFRDFWKIHDKKMRTTTSPPSFLFWNFESLLGLKINKFYSKNLYSEHFRENFFFK